MHDELIMAYRDWTWSYVSHTTSGMIQKENVRRTYPLRRGGRVKRLISIRSTPYSIRKVTTIVTHCGVTTKWKVTRGSGKENAEEGVASSAYS